MPALVDLNITLYQLLIPVFPPDLRKHFRETMVLTFEEQLAAGTASAWMDFARDLVSVALPYRAAMAIVPILTLATSSVLFSFGLWLVGAAQRHCGR